MENDRKTQHHAKMIKGDKWQQWEKCVYTATKFDQWKYKKSLIGCPNKRQTIWAIHFDVLASIIVLFAFIFFQFICPVLFVLLCVSVDAVFHYSFIHVTKCTSATITKINHTVYQKHTTKAIPFPISTERKTPSHFSHTVFFCSFSIVLFCKRIRVQ